MLFTTALLKMGHRWPQKVLICYKNFKTKIYAVLFMKKIGG